MHLARFEALAAAGRKDEARDALQVAIDDDLHARTRLVPDYRPLLYAGWDIPLLFRLAREHQVAIALVKLGKSYDRSIESYAWRMWSLLPCERPQRVSSPKPRFS